MRLGTASVSLAVASVLMVFGLLECGTRVYDAEYRTNNFLVEVQTLFSSSYPAQYDPELGWIPREGFSGEVNAWGTDVRLGDHGVRSNGPDSLSYEGTPGTILAVGDSFTFGDEVSDHETWPALLEQRLQTPVINGGVFGFGVDQAFLRAQRLAEIYHPKILIFSFMFSGIVRSELSERTAVSKPYFELQGGRLALRNTPVPQPTSSKHLGPMRRIFGYSYAIHKLMMYRFRGVWLQGGHFLQRTRAHEDGLAVTCELFKDLEDWASKVGIEDVYVLVQYTKVLFPRELALIDQALECLAKTSITVVDIRSRLVEIKAEDPEAFRGLFTGHMTLKGNTLVVEELYPALTDSADIPTSDVSAY